MSATKLTYSNKVILAPMVRIGKMASRLLALRYGADIVYAEELIDHKIIRCERIVNKTLDTVDFCTPEGDLVFRTCNEERSKVVFQMGTADPERAVQAAKVVEGDVAGIDVNMGCPKPFSIKGGMGAALLSTPDIAASIIKALAENVKVPVTCKIRLLPSKDETVALAKRLHEAGAVAIGVHGRLQAQRPREPVTQEQCDVVRAVQEALPIPVIANGGSLDIQSYNDIAKFKEMTGCSSVMLARAAQWNMSVFRKEGLLPYTTVCRDFLKIALEYDSHLGNIKYCMQQYFRNQDVPEAANTTMAKTIEEVAKLWSMEKEYHDILRRREEHKKVLLSQETEIDQQHKRARLQVNIPEDVITMDERAKPDLYTINGKTPKALLVKICKERNYSIPSYEPIEREYDRRFVVVATVNGKRYASSFWERKKKTAMQQAAIVCLKDLGLWDRFPNGF